MQTELTGLARPARAVRRVRHEVKRRDLTVTGVEAVGRHFVRVTLGGEALADFASDSFDDHVKLLFPVPGGEPVMRDYTPRAFDRARRELVIEFVLHEEGPASDWARQARVGQTLVVAGPRGSMVIPADYDWHLLVGDASALPALCRRVAELPADARVHVLALLPEDADGIGLPASSHVRLTQVQDDAALLQSLRAMPWPDGEGFVWCAGEAALMKQVRHLVLDERAHPKEAARIAAYWKRGVSDHHERLD